MGIITDGLIGYWHYQQGISGSTWGNIAPDNKGQYNGKINGATLKSDGMYFDGIDDFVEMPSLPTDGIFEVEMIVKIEETLTNGLIYGYMSTQPIQVLLFGVNNNNFTSSKNSSYGVAVKGSTISVNHQVDGQNEKVFIDSKLKSPIGNISLLPTGSLNQSWTIGRVTNQHYKGLIISLKVYNRKLTDTERLQNFKVGTQIGLDNRPPQETSPNPTIINISKNTISDELNMNRAYATFSFDVPVVEFKVNVLGVSHSTGRVAEYGSRTVDEMKNYTVDQLLSFTIDDARSISSGTEIIAEIDWTELYQEGENRVNIYGRSLNNEWTPYEG